MDYLEYEVFHCPSFSPLYVLASLSKYCYVGHGEGVAKEVVSLPGAGTHIVCQWEGLQS